MGGGTAIVEALANGRRAVGTDVNSLAVFLARTKCTVLTSRDVAALREWADATVPQLAYHDALVSTETICARRSHNLEMPPVRPVKKFIALALESLSDLPSVRAQGFARAVLLNVSQLALNGRRSFEPLPAFRERVSSTTHRMIEGADEFRQRLHANGLSIQDPQLLHVSASLLATQPPFANGDRADLVVTSPPYPGIHVLYHRWQVDGRKETPAPYWIAACQDGNGAGYYSFAERRRASDDDYFRESLKTLRAVRAVTKRGGIVIQMLAFAEPRRQLRRYLGNMEAAGFRELRLDEQLGLARHRRIWRGVPGRQWHASLKGQASGSREVVLVHEAI